MPRIPRWMRYLSLAAIAVVVLAAGLWTAARLATPTAEQRAAMAIFERPVDWPGDNAFSLMLTAARAVPASSIEAVTAEEARRVEQYRAQHMPGGEIGEFDSALDHFPVLEVSPADGRRFCRAREPCLARVQANLPAYQRLIETHGLLLDRLDRVTRAGHYRQPWPHSPVSLGIGPSFQELFYPATRHALRFAAGQRQAGLEGACRALAGWRRIGANADSMLVRMITNAFGGEGYAGLIADMLAELPVDVPIPEPCDAVRVPPEGAELLLCNAMRGEYALTVNLFETLDSAGESYALMFDGEASAGLSAERHARFCRDPARQWVAEDLAEIEPYTPDLPWSWQCIANVNGCILVAIGEGLYDDYAVRTNDFGFRLKALATLTWLRDHMQPGTSIAPLLDRRPDAMRSTARDFSISPDGQALLIPLHDPTRDAPARLPLPGRGARPADPEPPPCPE